MTFFRTAFAKSFEHQARGLPRRSNVSTMPSNMHETIIEMFRDRPSLAPELLGNILGVPIPEYGEASLDSAEFTEVTPTEYRADAVVLLSEGAPVLAVVVEVQRKPDKRKRWTWPVYLASVRARRKCPAVLLVICPDRQTATWSGECIELGHPGWVLSPMVIGPEALPVITDDKEAARAPELAVLAAPAHGGTDDQGRQVLEALIGALACVAPDKATLYADYVGHMLPAAARHLLEALLKTGTDRYQSDFARRWVAEGKAEGKAEGIAEGEAKAIILFLSARGIDVPEEDRERIMACTDLVQLGEWVKRAAVVNSVNTLFD
jgi:hypothetical protein